MGILAALEGPVALYRTRAEIGRGSTAKALDSGAGLKGTGKPPIDWRLCKERHQVECFFNKLKRFRRIALRCEKTISAFMGARR